MQFMLLFSRQGKLRLQKWYVPLSDKERKKISRDLVQTILARKPKMCSFLEWRDLKIVYKRYVNFTTPLMCTSKELCFSLIAKFESSINCWPWTRYKEQGLCLIVTVFPVFWFRYASLYFCCAVEDQDNELITLEIIHRYVELLDKYFGSVSPINVTHGQV